MKKVLWKRKLLDNPPQKVIIILTTQLKMKAHLMIQLLVILDPLELYFSTQIGAIYDTVIIFISAIMNQVPNEVPFDAGTIVLPVNMIICISGIIICVLSLV